MELIVVDDCSPDRTGEIAEQVAAELRTGDFSVRILHHEVNEGGSAALKNGFGVARGEYVCWLSADDAYALPEKTENQLAVMSSGADLVYDSGYRIGSSFEAADVVSPHWARPHTGVPDTLYNRWPTWRILAIQVGNPINGSSVMVRRDVVERLGTFDPSLRNIDQDSDMWQRLTCLGVRFGTATQIGTFYRIHAGQTSNLTEAVEWGCALVRTRILLTLSETKMLTRVLNRAWPTLLLSPPGRFRHFALVSQILCRLGLESQCGILPRLALKGLRRELIRYGFWDPQRQEQLMADAAASSQSPEFQQFVERLRNQGVFS